MRSGQLPDRPPRKRERPRWPELLLIAGITLTVAGFVLTVGPLAPDLGGTDASRLDGPSDDPPDADAGDEIEESETTGIRGTIGTTTSGDDESARAADDETREGCVVE